MATNNAINLTTPVPIAKGGTNATSMATSTGIVTYNGTSLVTSSTAKIDSSNRYSNSSQPCFLTTRMSLVSNVTGDGTSWNYLSQNTRFDQNSNLTVSSNTVFTAPVTGKYRFRISINPNMPSSTAYTHYEVNLITTGKSFKAAIINPGKVFQINNFQSGFNAEFAVMCAMTSGDTCSATMMVSGSTKTVQANPGTQSLGFCGYLIC